MASQKELPENWGNNYVPRIKNGWDHIVFLSALLIVCTLNPYSRCLCMFAYTVLEHYMDLRAQNACDGHAHKWAHAWPWQWSSKCGGGCVVHCCSRHSAEIKYVTFCEGRMAKAVRIVFYPMETHNHNFHRCTQCYYSPTLQNYIQPVHTSTHLAQLTDTLLSSQPPQLLQPNSACIHSTQSSHDSFYS